MKFSELVNIDDLKKLCEGFTSLTGMVTAILDLDGNVLIATGWQDICTCFHRVHPTTAERCRESDTVLAGKLTEGDQANVYRCKNGLVDVAIPIKLHGRHIANLFTGQFFLEPPDINIFIRQAEEFGFDKEAYLKALDRVPTYSQDKVNSAMSFLSQIGRLLGEMGLARKELEAANTEKQQETKRLGESEQQFRTLVNTIPDLIWLKDREGVFLSCNRQFERFFGTKEANIIGKTDYDFVDTELADHFRKHDRKAVAAGNPSSNEEWVTFAEGGHRALMYTTKTPMHSKDGTLIGILGIGRDITTLHQAHQNIIREKETAQKYLDVAGVMFAALNKQGEITLMNKKGYQILGYPEGELLGRNWFEVCLPASIQDEIKEVFRQQMSGDFKPFEYYENAIFNRAGEERMISFHNTLLQDETGIHGVLFSGEDITERKQAEAQHLELEIQLAQKHKIEALGMMAGGMAHNFNNNLAIILGGIDLTRIKLPDNSEVIPLLDNAKIAVLRSRDLIQNILSYSRQGVLNREPVQMALVVNETLKLLRSTTPTTVKIHYLPDAECQNLTIQADSTRIQEALINLCNNAIQSMDERGELIISLKSIALQPRDIPAQYQCSPGAYLQLSVQDSGCGMTEDLIERIFDPFFTTKAVDQGTGMGLATLQGMVVQHGGLIKVQSTPDQGSTFELYFPLSNTTQPAPSIINTALPHGSEKIIFLDDNDMLANLGKIMLSELGYQVCTMTSSTETLKLFQANPDHFDLVITDQTVPDMTGHELIQELRKIRPNLAAILCTGYSSKVDEDIAKKFKINAFLMKPLELTKLAQTVRRVLDGIEIG